MSEDNSKPIIKNEDSFGPIGAPVFEPRLYIQRYCYVKQELAKHNVKSVVDFGSAECKISRFLVQIPTVERIALVDLDKKLLEQHMYSVRPLTTDYLNRKDVTTDVDIYHGSVTDLDKCIVGFEAVSMVEIIEHLVSDVLSAAVTMVFGQLQPRVVVVTTPNSDFNVLFPNFSGFRHWDHKFEWSQEEFKEWCDRVASRYGYSVDYGGVGLPPEGSEHLGMCSQAATFVRQREYVQPCSSSTRDCYELIAHTCYPCKEKSSLSEEEQFLMENFPREQWFQTYSGWLVYYHT
ncbi:small RNA 2'-O-methyltransferase-like isoform X2 [Mya arenaria]|nr:small RNA 2'-O-methyltransferase-like isoform X2 [Mya arenaria]